MAFEHDLEVRVTRRHKDGVTVECLLHDSLMNSQGVLHGGVIASIADEAAWHALENHYGSGKRKSTTTELKVNYLRPIVGKKAVARATVARAGRTLVVSRVDIYDAQRNLGAIGIVTYMLL
jgi:uncharacterized protein (TIGR00369 family)